MSVRITDANEIHFNGPKDRDFLGQVSYSYGINQPVLRTPFRDRLGVIQTGFAESGHPDGVGSTSIEEFNQVLRDAEMLYLEQYKPDAIRPDMRSGTDTFGNCMRVEQADGEELVYHFAPKWAPVLYTGALALSLQVKERTDRVAALLLDGTDLLDEVEEVELSPGWFPRLEPDDMLEISHFSANRELQFAQHGAAIFKVLKAHFIPEPSS